MRDYTEPKMPANWSGEAKAFYLGLVDVLDELHNPVQESWLSEALKAKINAETVDIPTYSTSEAEYASFQKGDDEYSVYRKVFVAETTDTGEITVGEISDVSYVLDASASMLRNGVWLPMGNSDLYWKIDGTNLKAYVGTSYTGSKTLIITLAYVKSDTPTPTPTTVTLFDNGYAEGITWSNSVFSNTYPTSYATTNTSHVASDGYLLIYISSGGTATNGRHFVTTDHVAIPSSATHLHVVARGAEKAAQMGFGIIEDGASNDTSYSGNAFVSLTGTTTEYVYTLPSSAAGASDKRVIITARGKADARRDARIFKVWID